MKKYVIIFYHFSDIDNHVLHSLTSEVKSLSLFEIKGNILYNI